MKQLLKKLVFSLFFFVFVSFLYSSYWYVDKSATGSNTGDSWGNAWTSFSSINWSSISPGDTVYISGGTTSKTYNEALIIGKSGTIDNRITITTSSDTNHNGTVIIDGQYAVTGCVIFRSYVTLDGNNKLKVTGGTSYGLYSSYGRGGVKITEVEVYNNGITGEPGGYAHGILLVGQKSSEVSHCTIYNNYKDGVNLGGSEGTDYDYHLVHHNHIYGNGDDGVTGLHGLSIYNNLIHSQSNWDVGHPDGVQTLGNYVKVYNNEIYDTVNALIYIDFLYGPTAGHAKVYNNLLYQTVSEDLAPAIRGIEVVGESAVTSYEDVLIANNTIIDLSFKAISVTHKGNTTSITDIKIVNNIMLNCYTKSSYGTVAHFGTSTYNNVIFDYNIIHQGVEGVSRIGWQNVLYSYTDFMNLNVAQANGFNEVPIFVSYTSKAPENDLHIDGTDTIVVDNGVDLSLHFSEDKDGNVRDVWDIGCYESVMISDTTIEIIKPKSIELSD